MTFDGPGQNAALHRQKLYFRADWECFGKSAGMRRNHQMAQAGDVLVAFWDGQSPGTAHMVQCMRQLGKPVVVIPVEATA